MYLIVIFLVILSHLEEGERNDPPDVALDGKHVVPAGHQAGFVCLFLRGGGRMKTRAYAGLYKKITMSYSIPGKHELKCQFCTIIFGCPAAI